MSPFSPQQKRILLVAILATFVAFLDGFIVTVALPAIEKDLGGGLSTQQWVVNAYLLTLTSLMLIAGSLSDIYGRLRILNIGLIGFCAASLLCSVAPNSAFIIAARGFQGAAGALLVPSSLALIMASFEGVDEGDAIGKWTSWTVIASVIGPLVGGLLVDLVSWRLIFAINVIPIAITLWLIRSLEAVGHVNPAAKIDASGAWISIVGLGALTYALTVEPSAGWTSLRVILPLAGGSVVMLVFLWHEYRTKDPMLPLGLFAIRNFRMGNVATVFVYGGLSVSGFLITIFVQQIGGYTALEAGLTFLPMTLLMFFLSPRFGKLAGRFGSRWFMTAGPLVASLGFLVMLRVDETVQYWTDLFPGIAIFGLGLSITVAPLTTAILGCIDKQKSGIGSAVNNAVSRFAGLITIAVIGVVVGSKLTLPGFRDGLLFTATLLAAGGIISAIGITNSSSESGNSRQEPES